MECAHNDEDKKFSLYEEIEKPTIIWIVVVNRTEKKILEQKANGWRPMCKIYRCNPVSFNFHTPIVCCVSGFFFYFCIHLVRVHVRPLVFFTDGCFIACHSLSAFLPLWAPSVSMLHVFNFEITITRSETKSIDRRYVRSSSWYFSHSLEPVLFIPILFISFSSCILVPLSFVLLWFCIVFLSGFLLCRFWVSA